MHEPSHLPASLVADPPIPDAELSALIDTLVFAAVTTDTDVVTIANDLTSGDGTLLPERTAGHGYRLDTVGAADWAMRHLREEYVRLEEVKAQADQWRREVDAWAESQSQTPTGSAAYFHGLLSDYMRRTRNATGSKSVALLTGTIETTQHQAAVKVSDPDALLAWCRTNAPDAIEVVPATERVPARAAKELGTVVEDTVEQDGGAGVVALVHTVRSFVTNAGVVVPGVEVEEPWLAVRVKPAS